MPDGSVAVTATVTVFVAVVPRTISLPPLTTTLVILVSPTTSSAAALAAKVRRSEAPGLPEACAAGTASEARARAPETAATVARIRMRENPQKKRRPSYPLTRRLKW